MCDIDGNFITNIENIIKDLGFEEYYEPFKFFKGFGYYITFDCILLAKGYVVVLELYKIELNKDNIISPVISSDKNSLYNFVNYVKYLINKRSGIYK